MDYDNLESNHFWASPSKKLNDPCEGFVNSKNINFGLNLIGKIFRMNSDQERNFIKKNAEKVLSINQNNGIYSLSKNPLNELMWSHYSNSYSGFCIKFDLNQLLKTDGILLSDSVSYSSKPPVITYSDVFSKNNLSHMKKSLFYKAKRWEYEEEYRIITYGLELYLYPSDAIKGIYFSLNMEQNYKNQIFRIFKNKNIDFYQIIINESGYGFKFEHFRDFKSNE